MPSRLSFFGSSPIESLTLKTQNKALSSLIDWYCYLTLDAYQAHEVLTPEANLSLWLTQEHRFQIPEAYYLALDTMGLFELSDHLELLHIHYQAYKKVALTCEILCAYLPSILLPAEVITARDHARNAMRCLDDLRQQGMEESIAIWRFMRWLEAPFSAEGSFNTLSAEEQAIICAALIPGDRADPEGLVATTVTQLFDPARCDRAHKTISEWVLSALIQTYQLRYQHPLPHPTPARLYEVLASDARSWMAIVLIPETRKMFLPNPTHTLYESFCEGLVHLLTGLSYLWRLLCSASPAVHRHNINNPSQAHVVPPGDPGQPAPRRHNDSPDLPARPRH